MENIFLDNASRTGNIFNLFTALFCQPDEDIINNKVLYATTQSLLEKDYPGCLEYVKEMQEGLKNYTQQELLIEYSRLFIGPYELLAPPYSSLYFEDHKLLMNNVTIWVLNYYNKMELEYDLDTIKDAPDHISIESEFIYTLIFKSLDAFQKKNYEEAQHYWTGMVEFFNIHFKIWVPKFCDQLIDSTENKFYKPLGKYLKQFVLSATFPEFPVTRK